MWWYWLGFFGVVGLFVLVALAFFSPVARWPRERFDRQENYGQHPYIPGFGARWESVGLVAQRAVVDKVLAVAFIAFVFAMLFWLGWVH